MNENKCFLLQSCFHICATCRCFCSYRLLFLWLLSPHLPFPGLLEKTKYVLAWTWYEMGGREHFGSNLEFGNCWLHPRDSGHTVVLLQQQISSSAEGRMVCSILGSWCIFGSFLLHDDISYLQCMLLFMSLSCSCKFYIGSPIKA